MTLVLKAVNAKITVTVCLVMRRDYLHIHIRISTSIITIVSVNMDTYTGNKRKRGTKMRYDETRQDKTRHLISFIYTLVISISLTSNLVYSSPSRTTFNSRPPIRPNLHFFLNFQLFHLYYTKTPINTYTQTHVHVLYLEFQR